MGESSLSLSDEGQDSLAKIIRSIPSDCLGANVKRSFLYLARDLILVATFATLIVLADSWIIGLPLSLFLGASVGGLFVLGHDCGHRSFARSVRVNNVIGHLVTSPVLWPFHVWRLDHDLHHRNTNHIDRDTAWRPVPYALWKRMPRFTRTVYLWTRSKVFFLGSLYTTFVQVREAMKVKSSDKFTPQQKREVQVSLWMTALIGGGYLASSILVAGWYGFVCLWLIPQLVFHALLSTFTYFHHTSPESRFLDKREWRPEVAQLDGSIHVRYPRLLEFFVHDINWHVPHHVCTGIPHYNLRRAHAALKSRYPDRVREKVFGPTLIREVTSRCHFVASKNPVDLSWVTYDEALAKRASRTRPATVHT